MKSTRLILAIVMTVALASIVSAYPERRAVVFKNRVNFTGSTFERNGVNITATAAELNIMDGVTSTAAEISYLDRDNWSDGTANGATVTETVSLGVINKTTVTMASTPLVLTYGGAGTNSSGGIKIYDFPKGRISVLGVVVSDFNVATNTLLEASDTGDFAFGTTVGTGPDLSSTEIDLCPKTTLATMTNLTDSALAAAAQFDGRTTAKDFYANLMVDADEISETSTNATSATIVFWWMNLGL